MAWHQKIGLFLGQFLKKKNQNVPQGFKKLNLTINDSQHHD